MRTKIQRWGNSLAVRIPKAFAVDMGLEEDTPVEIGVVEGDLVVSPPPTRAFTLASLLAEVTENNRHREVETGPAVGGEVW
jgi:antitoxin MazE